MSHTEMTLGADVRLVPDQLVEMHRADGWIPADPGPTVHDLAEPEAKAPAVLPPDGWIPADPGPTVHDLQED